MTVARGRDSAVYEWHKAECVRLWKEIVTRFASRPKPSQAVKDARDRRWRHYGAMGQIYWSRTAVSYIARLPTATEETKRLAQETELMLDKLLTSLKNRKDSLS